MVINALHEFQMWIKDFYQNRKKGPCVLQKNPLWNKKLQRRSIVKGIIVNEGCLQIRFGFVVRARVTQRLTQFSKHCLPSTI